MARGEYRDPEKNAVLFHGATVTDLANIFGGSQTDVQRKIAGKVTPVTGPGVTPIRYAIRDAAPYLVPQTTDAAAIERAIMRMSPAKLPPQLSDTFWKAQRARLQYQEEAGELWKTERVVEALAEAFKPAAMAIKMFKDTVGQEHTLTPAQAECLVTLSDGLLATLHRSLVEKFAAYTPAPDEHGMVVDLTEDDDGLGD